MVERLITDIGGSEAGEIPRGERPLLYWERQLVSLFNLLANHKLKILNLDEFRRKVEEMTPEEYVQLGFYGRRREATIRLLFEKNYLTPEELDSRTREVLSREVPADARQ